MASESTSLNDLPDEILLEIFSHFGTEDLCLIIVKVCKWWNVLVKALLLRKTLSYSCDRSSDINDIEEVLTAAPALHSFIVRGRDDVSNILEFLFHKQSDLRKLILICCNLGENSTGLLANIVTLYPSLEFLSLDACHPLTSASYHLIPSLKKLSELYISDCQGVSGQTIRLIADSCQQLKILSLNGVVRFWDDDVIHVVKKLGKQLTNLVLKGPGLTDLAYSYLNNCARLQELELSWCEEMTDRGLLEGIGSLHDLTQLRLTEGYNLTAQALSTFLHRRCMTSIVSLNLSLCYKLNDEGLKGIAERCLHLEKLTVCWCSNVTDTGISMVINHCKHMRVLNLRGLTSITGEGWLALVPSHLPHLRLLCLELCNNMCDKSVEELMAAVPELEVIK